MIMKMLFLSLACWLTLVQIIPAQAVPAEIQDPKERELLDYIGSLNRKEPAFRPIALQRMLQEANFLSEKLKLPTPHPIKPDDIVKYHISPPWFGLMPDTTPGLSAIDKARKGKITAKGTIETTNYSFGFSDGMFSVVNQLQPDEVGHYQEWIHIPSIIDASNAYEMATQWLAAAEVNIGLLEKKYGAQKRVEQAYIWNPPGSTNKSMLPIFTVSWGNDSTHYVAEVRVLGITKELLSLRVGEPTITRRRPLVISSVADLDKYLNAQSNLPTMQLHRPLTNSISSDSTNMPGFSLPRN